MVIRNLKVTIDRERVLHQIDCRPDCDIYEEVTEEYRQMEEEIYSLCEPVLLVRYSAMINARAASLFQLPPDTPLLFVISSIGGKISEFSTAAFQNGDYLRGMLADAMADSALTSLEKEAVPHLKEICRQYHVGIEKRLDAPKDIPMQAQKLIFEMTQAHELAGMKLSSGYMLDPVKSGAMIYVLTKDTDKFNYRHDCRKCARYDCKLRSVPDVSVTVTGDAVPSFNLSVKEHQSLLEALTAHDPSYTAVCGGRGTCGKCRIQVLEGNLPVTESDRNYFSQEQLALGFRLACRAYPQEPLQIALKFQREREFSAVSEYVQVSDTMEMEPESQKASGRYGIAIDIGTTTLAFQLLSVPDGKRIRTLALLNRQRSFGADVVSRILASTQGRQAELCQCIRQDLNEGILRILEEAGAAPEALGEIVISGNTTMIHLLMKYDCSGLGVSPFTPVNIDRIEGSCESILGNPSLLARVRILPSVSVFVGGDIVSGLYHCNMHQSDDCTLLVDLGTNGEIALCGRGRMLASSTAAGPAFEGGNITWGTGSVPGAICGATIFSQGTSGDIQVSVRTIGEQPPTGICGTGALEILAGLLNAGLVDETGYLDDAYGDTGFPLARTEGGEQIVFTQKDIRELQLAKSALRAGIETLCLRFGIRPEEISRVYLAGGFGLKLDCRKAIRVGLLPPAFEGKITAVGNSSLAGAAGCLLSEDAWEQTSLIARETVEIPLASDQDFNRLYMEHMYFD